jgi:NAD(P)-dependent dehydrogenase (short-subunit alcohol dehydrogenase family)
MAVAIVTGASRGLGRAVSRALARRGWSLVVDGRDAAALDDAARELRALTDVAALAGDVSDEDHRVELVSAALEKGPIHTLVNNAGVLGASPPPRLESYPLDTLEQVLRINLLAPLRLFQLCASYLEAARGSVVNVTSEAAIEGFENWGGYGASKAALELASRTLAREHPGLRVYWVDPGDLNTRMEQEGFPDEDVSDRPDPEVAAPAFVALIEGGFPSGRYEARRMALAPGPARAQD